MFDHIRNAIEAEMFEKMEVYSFVPLLHQQRYTSKCLVCNGEALQIEVEGALSQGAGEKLAASAASLGICRVQEQGIYLVQIRI